MRLLDNSQLWYGAKVIGCGGYGTVFRLRNGLIAKVGSVNEDEAITQRFYHSKRLALPVLAYFESWTTPTIQRKACPKHGARKHVVDKEACTCHEMNGVIIMPEAVTGIVTKDEFEYLQERINKLESKHPELNPWDDRDSNCARYQGVVVGLDFGYWGV